MTSGGRQPVRRISLVVPMRDEADRVEQLVADIAAQDFAGELEVFVADGRSADGSVERLRAAAARHRLRIELLDNPSRSVPPGLNACIARATGDLVVRLDCKARYPADYLRRCALAAEETGAWNVGGLAVPEGVTATERAAACAMASPFGGIGWTRHADAQERVETDTVYCGAFRPEAFRRVGAFLDLGQNHDDEFNLRLRRAGGKVIFDPGIRAYYTGRRSLAEVFRQYHDYGFWKVPVMLLHRRVLSARSLVPAAFVTSLAGLAAAAPRRRVARRLLAVELLMYGAAAVAAGTAAVARRHEPPRLVPRVVAVFATFHLAYGIGMLRGVARALSGTWRSEIARAPRPPAA